MQLNKSELTNELVTVIKERNAIEAALHKLRRFINTYHYNIGRDCPKCGEITHIGYCCLHCGTDPSTFSKEES